MKKRYLFVAMILGILAITGCSGKKDNKEETTAVEKKITLTVGMWGSSPEETALVDGQIRAFQEKYPNISVTKQVAVGDYGQELQANFAAGTEPDIFYVDSADSVAFIEKGAIVPINEYIDKTTLDSYNPNLLDAFSKDGKIYGLPKDFNPLVMFINKEMFEKAGAKIPTTWVELTETLKTLKDAGDKGLLGKDFKYPMAIANNGERVAPFILQNGGKIYDIKNNKLEFNSNEAVEAYNFHYELLRNKYAETAQAMGEGWEGDAFARNKVAIVYSGGWLIPFMRSAGPNVNYEIAKLPKGKEEGTIVFTVAYAMSRNTKYPEEAAKLMEFLTGEVAQRMTIESGLGLPSRNSLEEEFINKYPERTALIEMTKFATPFRFGANGRKVNDELTKVGETIYSSIVEKKAKVNIEELLKNAENMLKK